MLIKQLTLYSDSQNVFCLSKPTKSNGFFPDDAFICGGWLSDRLEGIPTKMGKSILLKVFDKPASDRIKFIFTSASEYGVECEVEGRWDEVIAFYELIESAKGLIDEELYLEVQV